MNAAKISYLSLVFYLLLLVIPLIIFLYLRIKLIKPFLIAIIRMLIQLSFVAVYLEYIFKLNNPFVNIIWIIIMIIVANHSVLKQSGLRLKTFFLYTTPAYVLSILFSFTTFLITFNLQTLFSARYFIPLGGMVLGNILRGNIISLERFYNSLSKRQDEYIYYISLGATLKEAIQPFMAEAIKAAVSPFIATVATMGLVSLPGMMTGQILGGATPLVAIQYQVVILVAILIISVVSTFLVILFSLKISLDNLGRIKDNIFVNR